MRKALVLVIGLSLLLGSAIRAVASGDQMLSGVVSDSAGRPLADAQVQLSELGVGLIDNYQTDSHGRFTVDRRPGPAALWRLQVSLDGYRPEESGWFSPAARLTQSFRLTPLYGRVQLASQGPKGEPVNGHVLIIGPGGVVVASEGFTQGRFAQERVATATYQVVVLASGFVTAAQEITVAGGRIGSALIRLKRDQATVSGTVLDSVSGLPVSGARVEVIRVGGGIEAEVISGAKGYFEMAVYLAQPGDYYLRLEAPGYRTISTPRFQLSHGKRHDFSGPESPSLLPSTARIDGVAMLREGGPAKEATVTLQLRGHGVVAEARTSAQGEFQFDQVPAGPGLAYRMRGDWDGDSVSTAWTEVPAGSITQVTLRPQPSVTESAGTGTLSGLVLSDTGSPIVGAVVEVLRRNQPMQTVKTDSFGAFVIHDLAATATEWFALEPYTARITKDDFAPSYEFTVDGQLATEFTLIDRLRTVIRATLHPKSKVLNGRLLDTDGRPVAGQSVELHNDGEPVPQVELTDSGGWYEFLVPLERPGLEYNLRVVAQGYQTDAASDLGDLVRKGLPLPTVWMKSLTFTFGGQIVEVDGRPVERLVVRALSPDGAVRVATWTDQFGIFRLDLEPRPFEDKVVLVVTDDSGRSWAMLTPPSQEIQWTIPTDWDLHSSR